VKVPRSPLAVPNANLVQQLCLNLVLVTVGVDSLKETPKDLLDRIRQRFKI
jgi:hypothetical protein